MKQFLIDALSEVYKNKPCIEKLKDLEIYTYENVNFDKKIIDELRTSDTRYEFSNKGLIVNYKSDEKVLIIFKNTYEPKSDIENEEVIREELKEENKKDFPDPWF